MGGRYQSLDPEMNSFCWYVCVCGGEHEEAGIHHFGLSAGGDKLWRSWSTEPKQHSVCTT